VDLKLTRAKDLLETAVVALTEALEQKGNGLPYEAGRSTAKAKRLLEDALEAINSTVDPWRNT